MFNFFAGLTERVRDYITYAADSVIKKAFVLRLAKKSLLARGFFIWACRYRYITRLSLDKILFNFNELTDNNGNYWFIAIKFSNIMVPLVYTYTVANPVT